ncbi:hypothetical protein BBJ28_00004894 [Nothophytophthora sp. Chile5]|nr:hypothetical protein BBJ28_00004894 [Nothophytophthora sp. Chile5]
MLALTQKSVNDENISPDEEALMKQLFMMVRDAQDVKKKKQVYYLVDGFAASGGNARADVVAAIERVLNVVRAARELHKSLVMDATLHHDMSSPMTAPSESTAAGSSDSAVSAIADSKEAARLVPLSPSSSSSTSSEFHPSSDDDDDDEPDVVEVAPPTGSRKREAATVDLSTSPTPTTRVKTPAEETSSIRSQISTALKNIKETSAESYSVAAYKKNASLVKQARADEYLHGWRPRDDPTFANLLDEMEIRLRSFKDSLTQDQRCEVIRGWLA